VTQRPERFNGIEINGWGNADLLAPPGSYPAGLFDRLRRQFEKPRVRRENYVLSPVNDLLAIRDEQLATTRAVARLGATLLRQEPWDLALIGFQAHAPGRTQAVERPQRSGAGAAGPARRVRSCAQGCLCGLR
jgi:hypothetical protein